MIRITTLISCICLFSLNANSEIVNLPRASEQVVAFYSEDEMQTPKLSLSSLHTNCMPYLPGCNVKLSIICHSVKSISVFVVFKEMIGEHLLMDGSLYNLRRYNSASIITLDNKKRNRVATRPFDENDHALNGHATIVRGYSDFEIDDDYSLALNFQIDLLSAIRILDFGFVVFVEDSRSRDMSSDVIFQNWYSTKHAISDWSVNKKYVNEFKSKCALKANI